MIKKIGKIEPILQTQFGPQTRRTYLLGWLPVLHVCNVAALLPIYLFSMLSGLTPNPAIAMEASAGSQNDYALCLNAISRIERTVGLPPALLRAIGLVESGRYDPQSGKASPWPWSINIEGMDHIFDTKDEAIQAVVAARAAGRQSIDVGCMQINLKHHPVAFASLQDAFDPETNVRYAATFLERLHRDMGAWTAAAGAYHSFTPALANAYVARVAAYWPMAAGYHVPGLVTPIPYALPLVDPYDVMTPEQKRLVQSAAIERAARDAAYAAPLERQQGSPAPGNQTAAKPRSQLSVASKASYPHPDQQASLDPTGGYRWR